MTLTILLLLPIVGGYVFSSTWYITNYTSARESGHRIYFRAAFYGAIMVICASLIHILFYINFAYYRKIIFDTMIIMQYKKDASLLFSKPSFPYILTISFLLGSVLGFILNLIQMIFDGMVLVFGDLFKIKITDYFSMKKTKAKQLARAVKNHDFENLLLKSINAGPGGQPMPVLVTLDCGKVYIGLNVRLLDPAENRKALKILPFASGYRDKDTHQLNLTTYYEDTLLAIFDEEIWAKELGLVIDNFEVVIMSDQIITVQMFNFELFENTFKDRDGRLNSDKNEEDCFC